MRCVILSLSAVIISLPIRSRKSEYAALFLISSNSITVHFRAFATSRSPTPKKEYIMTAPLAFIMFGAAGSSLIFLRRLPLKVTASILVSSFALGIKSGGSIGATFVPLGAIHGSPTRWSAGFTALGTADGRFTRGLYSFATTRPQDHPVPVRPGSRQCRAPRIPHLHRWDRRTWYRG